MVKINLNTAGETLKSHGLKAYEKVGALGGRVVTFIKSDALKPAIIGSLALILAVSLLVLAIFILIKALILTGSTLYLLFTGGAILTSLASLGWACLIGGTALMVGLLALIPFATSLGAFKASSKVNI